MEDEDKQIILKLKEAITNNEYDDIAMYMSRMSEYSLEFIVDIYKFCAANSCEILSYMTVYNKLKLEQMVRYEPNFIDYIEIACKNSNKNFLQFVHGIDKHHINFYTCAMGLFAPIEMLEWIEENFQIIPYIRGVSDFYGHVDEIEYVKHMSLYKDESMLYYFFNKIRDLLKRVHLGEYLLFYPALNNNVKLLQIMYENVENINSFNPENIIHKTFYNLSVYKFFINLGYVEVNAELVKSLMWVWNHIIYIYDSHSLRATIPIQVPGVRYSQIQLTRNQLKDGVQELKRVLQYDVFWRKVFFEAEDNDNLYLIKYTIKRAKAIISECKTRARKFNLPEDVVQYIIDPMF